MPFKSFFLGVVTGIVLTFVGLFVYGLSKPNSASNDPIQYLEKPVSYENKKTTSVKVFQLLGNATLAREASDKIGDDVIYSGNTVLVLGKDFYSDQIVTVKNPQRIETYSYTNNGRIPMTVSVIDGEIE